MYMLTASCFVELFNLFFFLFCFALKNVHCIFYWLKNVMLVVAKFNFQLKIVKKKKKNSFEFYRATGVIQSNYY